MASDSHGTSSSHSYNTGYSATSAHDYSRVHEILMTGLSDLGLTSHGHLDLARLLTEKITRKTRSLQPPRPHVPFRDTEAQSDTTSAQHLISVLARIWASKLGEESGRILEGAGAGQEHEIAKSISARAEQSWSSTDRRALLPPKHQADIWLQTFLCGPNKLMCICSPTESHRLLESLYGSKQEIGERSECLITSQLAVGARFTADTNEQIYTAIYESARMQAENCIEKDEAMFLWVVPILLLRCIYLLGTKPRSCWLILGLAIRVAQTYRIDQPKEQCYQLSDADNPRWREVWRAIIFLDTWLAITLGRVSQVSALTSHDPFIQDIRNELRRPNHELEVNMAKLAVFVNEFLQHVHSSNQVELTDYERYLHSLEEWSASLPRSLQYFLNSSNATEQSDLSSEDEFASLYLEVFYFATVLIVTRPLLLDVVTTWREQQNVSVPFKVRFFAQTCADSAIQIAHISTTMVRRGFICQRSWLVTTLNYYASLVLVLSLSVKGSRVRWNLTSNQEASRRQVEMNALKLSVGVLSHCAQQDPLAAQFLKTVNVFKVILEAQDLSEPEEVRRFSSGAANPEQVTTSASHMSRSSSYFETASTGSRSHLPLSTASSPFDLQAYPSPSSLPHPSFRHIQPTSAPQLASPLAPTASQNGSFSMPLDWSPSSILVMNSAMDVSIDYESGLVGPPTQHYQPFLQDLYQFEDIYSGSQC